MCAIAGLFGAGPVDTKPLSAMARSMAHRGPDQHSIRRYGGKSVYAALGVERLAIVDIDGGGQPAADPSGRFRVALNGEIYNHAQLRTALASNGVVPESNSDTAVLAALVSVNGLDRALQMAHGMFAAAIVDTLERSVTLVRDRMGVKPLHWTRLPDGTVAFASEIRGLLAHPRVTPAIDPVSVQQFLLFEYIPTPRTIWSGIHKVEPGTWMRFTESGCETKQWWEPPVTDSGRPGNFERWSQSLHGALRVAVSQRAQADVDVGYLLSGGLDSASVAAIAAAQSTQPIRTFSLAVTADGFDESENAAKMAAHLGAEHASASLGPSDLEPILSELILHMDEPLADSSLVSTWKLMQLVKSSGLKCVQSGDGADEILGGYPTYFAHQFAGTAGAAKGLLRRAVNRLPVRTNGVSKDYMARRFVDGLGAPWQRRHQVWMGAWLPNEVGATPETWARVDAVALAAGESRVGRAMYLDQRMYLSDGVLVKVDRAAGAHGIEVRSPFLDHSIVELTAQMGTGHHIQGMEGKRVLREAMNDLLPQATRNAAKKGFGTPIGPWLRGSSTNLLDGLADKTHDWLNPDALNQCIEEHRAGTADHRRRLWSALVLGEWRAGPHGTP